MAEVKRVLVTGASGFLGLNLRQALGRRVGGPEVLVYDRTMPRETLAQHLASADAACHFEAVYRPVDPAEFEAINLGLTRELVAGLEASGRRAGVIYASSTRSGDATPYGKSRRRAEEILEDYARRTGAAVTLLRLPNEFGKWDRPDHNSVVATFCYRLARGLEIEVREPGRVLNLAYVDDIVDTVVRNLESPAPGARIAAVEPTFSITVGELAEKVRRFAESRRDLALPDFADGLTRRLYATYLAYLEGPAFVYPLLKRSDPRGELAEYFKSPHLGQIFVSRTRPGITRGNHYHDTKVEKFCVLDGEALIRFRHVVTGERVDHRVAGEEFRVVDIPPGWTHSIENVGATDLIVLFWASETFDPENPDTFPCEVLNA